MSGLERNEQATYYIGFYSIFDLVELLFFILFLIMIGQKNYITVRLKIAVQSHTVRAFEVKKINQDLNWRRNYYYYLVKDVKRAMTQIHIDIIYAIT